MNLAPMDIGVKDLNQNKTGAVHIKQGMALRQAPFGRLRTGRTGQADTEVGPYIAGLESPAYPLYLKKWGNSCWIKD